MKVLLDTHVFLWAHADPRRLGSRHRMVESSATELLVSAVSSWEIAIKAGIGRLDLPEPPARWMPDRLRRLGATPVAVEHAHALAVADLPPIHKDPFDRMLVAQAAILGVPLLSADRVFEDYDIDLLLVE